MPATLTVKDLMRTGVEALTPGTTLQEARRRMTDLEIRHLPVVDDKGHLVGIVSQRDVARALDMAVAAQGVRATISAGDVMHRRLVTARVGDPAHEVVAHLIENKIGAVPVVDDDNHLIGLVTETDFLVIAHQALLGIEPRRHART